MKVAFIVPYFGKLPNYFQLFLDSCKYNTGYDWILITDDLSEYTYPQNVHRVEMTFDECKRLFQLKFDFQLALGRPQKLCDYKCAYGYVFSDMLSAYDWWGHCDLDQVFGNLSEFITDNMLSSFDKIGSLGHLTLYRNTPDNNKVFMSTERYKEVFTTERGCGFDEWLPGNINEIYLQTDRSVELHNYGADIHSYHVSFRTVEFDVTRKQYVQSSVTNSIFLYDHGRVQQLYLENGILKTREFPYVHLQKRTIKDYRHGEEVERYYIIPNRFVDGDNDPKKLLIRSKRRGYINTQYIIVKWKSLMYRLREGDWAFSNVFR